MEKNHQAKNRFFKVMTSDFHTKVSLPKAFCRNQLRGKKSAIIKSGKGIWKVNVSKDSNSSMMCFEDGWGDFVRQHDLTVGDVVVFEHIGKMHFNAFVFDFTACEKEFQGSGGAIKSGSCDNPYFIVTIKYHHSPTYRRSCVNIPAEFWKSNGLSEKTSVNLRDPSGKKWKVELKFYKTAGNKRLIMSGGWKQFYESNKLKNGDVCTFQLNRNPKRSTVASMDAHIEPAKFGNLKGLNEKTSENL